MIIISPNITLGPTNPERINGNNPLIGIDNLVTASNMTATTQDADFPLVNLANPDTYNYWKATSNATQVLTLDTGVEEPDDVDYLAVAGHNLAGRSVLVEAYTGAGWETVVPEAIPANNDPLMFRWQPNGLAQVRMTIDGGDDAAQIAVLYIGKLLVMQRRVYVGYTPYPFAKETKVTNNKSENGHFLGRILLQESINNDVSFSNLTPSWVRTYFKPFIEEAKTRPFFWAWRPESYPDEVGFSWLRGDPQPQNSSPNGRMSVTMQLGGFVTPE